MTLTQVAQEWVNPHNVALEQYWSRYARVNNLFFVLRGHIYHAKLTIICTVSKFPQNFRNSNWHTLYFASSPSFQRRPTTSTANMRRPYFVLIQCRRQSKRSEGHSPKMGGTKIDWIFAHKNWYFTTTNYALFLKFWNHVWKKRRISTAAFISFFRLRPIQSLEKFVCSDHKSN